MRKNTITTHDQKQLKRYPASPSRLFLNITTSVLSIIIAFVLLKDYPLLISYYAILTFIIAIAMFWLKLHFHLKRQEPEKERSPNNTERTSPWKSMALLFLIIAGIIMFPLLLTRVLPPQIWFIVIISIASGTSLAEPLFYVYCRRRD
jgi:hypothetical protein